MGGGPVILTNNTIINNKGKVLTSANIGYGGGVSIQAVTVTLTSNTIIGNTANTTASGFGGGVHMVGSRAFTLTNNSIMTNTAGYRTNVYLSGGGLQIVSSRGVFSGNVIAGNYANGNALFGNGGGVAIMTSTVAIQGGQIRNNKTAINCEGYGGGLYARASRITIDATRVENNCAGNTPFYGLGGGLAVVNSSYTLTNALVINNYAFPSQDSAVGGLNAGTNSPGLLVNNTFANNKAVSIHAASPLTATNNIIVNSRVGISATAAVSVTFNDFFNNTTAHTSGFPFHVTNIVINPQLDASFHLNAGSPAIDAGTRTNAPDHDLDGQPRPMAGSSGFFRVDIGADERTGSVQRVVDLDAGQADLTIVGPGNPAENPNSNGPNDWLGYSVLGHDVNGDGRPDLAVAAEDWAEDFDTLNATGRLFGLSNFGTRITGTLDLLTDTADLTVVSQYLRQHLGSELASGDLNGDGQRDLIAGSFENDNDNTYPVTPTVFVLYGGSSLVGTRTLTNTTPADFMLRAPAQDFFSFSDKNALTTGDLNGDRVADLVVGDGLADDGASADTGAAFVIFGRSNLGGLHDLAVTPADYTLYGPAANAHLGSVAGGRVNADAQLDLVARTDTTAYVILGPISSGTRHLSSTPANITITGLQFGGVIVADLTGDGHDDVILGSGSKLYVVPGPLVDGQTYPVASAAVLTLTGASAASLAVGDVLGDAWPELIVGAPFLKRAFVVPGKLSASGTLPILDVAPIVVKSAVLSFLGFDVATGDLDFDGRHDLIVSTKGVNVESHPNKFKDAGTVYVLYGPAACYEFKPPAGVGVEDIQAVAGRWYQVAGQPYDQDGDERITVVDIMRLSARWGQFCS